MVFPRARRLNLKDLKLDLVISFYFPAYYKLEDRIYIVNDFKRYYPSCRKELNNGFCPSWRKGTE